MKLVDKLVSQLEASPAGCTAVEAGDAGAQLIESDIAAFRRAVPTAAGVRFDVLDCRADGFVHRGERIVISARLAQRPKAQRFFIMAHELGHLSLRHHAAMARFVADAVGRTADESAAGAVIDAGLTPLSRQAEFDADAYAAKLMRDSGLDPEDAARLFDGIGPGQDNRTHPSPARRARAIRAL